MSEHPQAHILRAIAEDRDAQIQRQYDGVWQDIGIGAPLVFPEYTYRIAPNPDADGWIPWHGGENPVPGKTVEHKLKIEPEFFQMVISGRKTFEIRKDDRGFQVGDTVTLCEYDPTRKGRNHTEDEGYTGRTTSAVVGYVTAFEQKPGYVVFSLVHRYDAPNAEITGLAPDKG